jgi:hypothetical protein
MAPIGLNISDITIEKGKLMYREGFSPIQFVYLLPAKYTLIHAQPEIIPTINPIIYEKKNINRI